MASVLSGLLDILYQPRCPACEQDMAAGSGLCAPCALSLYENDPACSLCAAPLGSPPSRRCAACARQRPPFDKLIAPYLYGGQLAIALQRLKYRGRPDIARTVAPLLAHSFEQAITDIDVIVPVPMHWTRLTVRGTNHADLIARCLRKRGHPPVSSNLLRRVRRTRAQAGLSRRGRARNIENAFTVPGRRTVAGLRILLLDDIATTCATISAAARALSSRGAAHITVFCAARAEP